MAFLHNRPLATVCLAILLSLTIASMTSIAVKLLLFAVLAVFACSLFLLQKWMRNAVSRPRFLAFLLVLAASAQLFAIFVYEAPFSRIEENEGEAVTAVGYVESIYYATDYGASFLFMAETANEAPIHLRLAVTVEGPLADLSVGERLSILGDLCSLRDERQSNEGKHLLADGAFGVLVADALPIPLEGSRADLLLRRDLSLLRDRMAARILSATEGEAGALMSAMLLGTREKLPDTLSRDFRRLGLSHVLALSGLHLNILIALFHVLAARLRLGRRQELAGALFLLLCYILLTGFSPSVLRAGIMAAAVSLSFFAAREADSVTSLFLSVLLIIIVTPSAIYDPSLWLSFAATLGILIYSEYKEKSKTLPVIGHILSSFLIGISAFAATLSAVALFFGEISWASPFSSILFVPLLSLYLMAAPIVLIFGNLLSLGSAASFFGNALIFLIRKCASLPNLLLDIRYPAVLAVLLFGTCLLFIYLSFFRTNGKKLLISVSLFLTVSALTFSICAAPAYTEKEISYTALPAGDLLLFSRGGDSLLYDATSGGYSTVEAAEELLSLSHETELDGYMLSHYHVRHPTTFARLLGRVSIRTLYLPTPESEEEASIYHELVSIAEKNAVSLYRYSPFEEFCFADLRFTAHKGHAPSEGVHKSLGLTVKGTRETFTYLGRGMNETVSGAITSASAVEISDILIFGTHGAPETEPISYTIFKKELRLVLISDAERLYPELLLFLEEHGVLKDETEALKIRFQ